MDFSVLDVSYLNENRTTLVARLPSLGMFSRFMRVVACINTSLLCITKQESTVRSYHFINSFPSWWTRGNLFKI